jgi:hypothetical protein
MTRELEPSGMRRCSVSAPPSASDSSARNYKKKSAPPEWDVDQKPGNIVGDTLKETKP